MSDDLISRSALLENYGLKNATKYGNETEEQQHNSYSTMMLYEIADMIYDAPAVDAKPVRHGRWLKHGFADIWRCTKCGRYAGDNSAYCPNCGAKMDAEAER